MRSRQKNRILGWVLAIALLLVSVRLVRVTPRLETETFLATAYSIGSITKSGEKVREGIVAADPDVIPLGSLIRVSQAGEYNGKYRVLDTGEKIRGKRIDIYIEDFTEAVEFGARRVEVAILRTPSEKRGGF